MLSRTWLCAGALVGVFSIVGCGDDPVVPPVGPTPPVVTTPPPTTPAPTPAPTPPPAAEPAALASLSIEPPDILSQGRPVGTVTLTAPAPAGGAVVALDSGKPEIAKLSSPMTVPAGQTSGTFTIDAATVSVASPVIITAIYLGVSKQAELRVHPPVLVPNFTVSSPSKGADACSIVDVGGSVDCVLDGSSSAGFVSRYLWTLKRGSNELFVSTGGSSIVPTTTCTFLSGGSVNSNGAVEISVSLQLEDRQGNRSGTTSPKTVAITPQGRCGY